VFTASLAAQPAEVSVRAEGWIQSVDCFNGTDGIAIRPPHGQNNAAQISFIISAKSVNLQDGASIGFVIYSPDNSTFNDTVASATMGAEWGGFTFWNLGTGMLNSHFGSGLPDTLITGGAALPGAGFQSDTFIDILTIDMYMPEDGVICIDSAFVEPSGAWLMTPDGPPAFSGGSGDTSVGGVSTTALCLTVLQGSPVEFPCGFPQTPPLMQVRIGDTLLVLDSTFQQLWSAINFSVTTTGLGAATVDSSGYTTYIPSPLDVDSTILLSVFYEIADPYTFCTENRITCSQDATILVLPPANCCDTPGDADHSGATNIGDATFMISRIFAGGSAPVCINEADADGDGAFNIADVSYLIARIFSGGSAPVCGNVVN